MISTVIFFLLSAGSFYLAFYLKGVLTFEGSAADHILFWGAIVLGVIFALFGIDRLLRFLGERQGNGKKQKKTAEPAPKVAKNPAWSFKASGALDSVWRMLGFFIAHTVILAGGCYVMTMLTVIGKMNSTLHWAPIAVAAIFYLVAFVTGYALSEEHPLFKSVSIFGCTKKEVSAAIGKVLSTSGYAYYHLRVVRVFALLFIAEAAVAILITPFALNFLVATPAILLISLIHHKPEGVGDIVNDVIGKREGDDWSKHLCPKCGAILGKGHLADSSTLTGQSQSLGSRTYTVTDKYTNGYDTLYVDRREKDYFISTHSTYQHRYSCPRCKHTWSKTEFSSDRTYI